MAGVMGSERASDEVGGDGPDAAEPVRSGDVQADSAGSAALEANGSSGLSDVGPDASGPSDPAPAGDTERSLLTRLFSARVLALGTTSSDRFWSWMGPALVAALAALLRLINLGHPRTLVFDETYYVKGAFTLLMAGFEAEWPDDANPSFESGNQDIYLNYADYVVHPPVGKWMIALGMRIGGPENSWAWRLAPAIVGIIAVFLLARTARQLFGSTAFGVIAGGLFAIDGVAIVHSRTALLDVFVMFWVVVAFACLVADRNWSRRRLAARAAPLIDSGVGLGRFGPRLGFRWWRFAAAIALGLACGTKWSGLYFFAVFAVVSVLWDATARRAVGIRLWPLAALVRDALPAAAVMVPTVLLTYLASWSAWFANPNSYDRDWWEKNPHVYPSWLPDVLVSWGDALRSLWAYHEAMWKFHTTLTNPHTYMANPWGWLLQLRPTSFYWNKTTDGTGGCGAQECTQAITSVGNPLIWWLATVALVFALYMLLRYRDWRAGAVLAGLLAGWVPWLFITDRTIFTFYTIAFAPWMYLALTYALVVGWEQLAHDPVQRRRARWAIGALLGLIVVISGFFYPIWVGMEVPYSFWHMHMWLRSWI